MNAEIGYSSDPGPATIQTAPFYSKLSDMIQSMPIGENDKGIINQSQSVGDGTSKGSGIAANWQVHDRVGLGM